jgi:hypothetical protein
VRKTKRSKHERQQLHQRVVLSDLVIDDEHTRARAT